MKKIMQVKNMKKYYHTGEVVVKALKDATFDVYEGEFIVILGQSGSGKSTLLNLIGGMDNATGGVIDYKGQEIQDYNEKKLTMYRRNKIGFVFQFYNLIPNLTAYENIKLVTDISQDPFDIEKLLEDVGLLDRKDHFPSQLSGGEQQRVAIARAVSKNPELLLCDEPTGALDVKSGVMVLDILKKLNKEYNKTVIIITHNKDISDIADRVFHLKDGNLDKIEENNNPLDAKEVKW